MGCLFFVGNSNRLKCEEAGIEFYIFPSPKGINVRTSLEKQLDPRCDDPRGPIASRGVRASISKETYNHL